MGYKPERPVTAANCPTREALERNVDTPGFRKESIHARHSKAKADRHRQNVLERAERNRK